MDNVIQSEAQDKKNQYECRTLRVDDAAAALGIGRSSAYALVREAETGKNNLFKVIRLGNSLLISRKSFEEYLEANGL